MNPIPVIAGTGLVTPLGNSAPQTWSALLDGQFIRDHAQIPFDPPGNLPRASSLGLRAAREALSHVRSDWTNAAALVVGTSKGAVGEWLAPSRSPGLFGRDSFGLAEVAADLSRLLDVRGPVLTLSAACASGLHALIRGVMLIRTGEARRVLVVASEAAVHPLFVGSFRRLGVLAPEGFGCRPLDQNRDGFLMSEAAAAVCLESGNEHSHGVRVDHYAMAGDATHLTGSSPDMAAVRHVLRGTARTDPIDVFHAHATGTASNDAAELCAIEECAAAYASPACVYSHKGALGHSQGAAGLVSVVINVMCHQTGIVPPNVRTTEPLPTRNLRLSANSEHRKVGSSIALAAGFGGPVAAVRLVSD